ncbi:MAG TPA: hypothetical protein PLN21_11370 [Gemmatales bacterium]|nr:hypothetical protein [Gemmatales bacterium]
MLRLASLTALFFLTSGVYGQTVADLKTDWSNLNNPNGPWTYREGTNALPAVTSWQSSLGGWTTAQPGWARSENGNNRLPFWFQSNGSETFTHDWLSGDIVVHSTDSINGVGNGVANVIWTSTSNGFVTISGNTWLGRDIGRANTWSLWKNATQFTSGVVSTGDPFSRANPFLFSNGSGGASVLLNIPVVPGDTIMYQIATNSGAGGDFTGVNMTVTLSAVPEPGTIMLCGAATLFLGYPCYRQWKKMRRRVSSGPSRFSRLKRLTSRI